MPRVMLTLLLWSMKTSYDGGRSSPSSNQHEKVRFSWAVDLDATGIQ